MRLLLVDDEPSLRELLRATFEGADVDVEEAASVVEAEASIARRRPDVVLVDLRMPGVGGLDLCRKIKRDPALRSTAVVVLTGAEPEEARRARRYAEAVVRKPFSPLELLAVVEKVVGGDLSVPARPRRGPAQPGEEVLLYARDLRHLLELERGQRALLQDAYLETVAALASALETKDTGTKEHSHRVQQYATVLIAAIDQRRLEKEPSTEYGFLLHDVGKIGIPDSILLKPGPLTASERRRMMTHTALGEQMLGGVAFLQGEGIQIVRSHHERWDGRGYPDGLAREEIPLGARVFAVADTLDAMTSDRVYRPALSWRDAREEIRTQAGKQFDPDVVDAFLDEEAALQAVHRELSGQ